MYKENNMKNEEIKLVLEQMDSKMFMIMQYLQRIIEQTHTKKEIEDILSGNSESYGGESGL